MYVYIYGWKIEKKKVGVNRGLKLNIIYNALLNLCLAPYFFSGIIALNYLSNINSMYMYI